MAALAYHITWTTYGTWLPGDARGWVQWGESGIQAPDAMCEQAARERMVESAVILAQEERNLVEETIRKHCGIRGWVLHAVQARSNHVHMVVSADTDSDQVMNQVKAWCSRTLSDAAGLAGRVGKKAGRRHWFTEGGDKRLIENEEYLNNAITYVQERQ